MVNAAGNHPESSGGAILVTGKTKGGKGGNVSLVANDYSHLAWTQFFTNPLILDGTIRAYVEDIDKSRRWMNVRSRGRTRRDVSHPNAHFVALHSGQVRLQ